MKCSLEGNTLLRNKPSNKKYRTTNGDQIGATVVHRSNRRRRVSPISAHLGKRRQSTVHLDLSVGCAIKQIGFRENTTLVKRYF